jgi:WD40 repeat protein
LNDKQKDYSSKREQIRNLRLKVFKAIEGEKTKAILAEKKALQKTKEAQIATDNATALYWSSEAGKINPIQGMKLLEKSLPKAKDEKIIKTIKQANATIFNQSNYHQWRRKRFEDIQSSESTPDSKWLIIKDGNDNSKVWSVETGKYPDFLKDEKNIRYATFSQDSQWLITRDVNGNSKVWSVETGKYYDFLKNEKIISDATFSQDSKWLITRDVNGYSKVWSVETGKYYEFFKNEKYSLRYFFAR